MPAIQTGIDFSRFGGADSSVCKVSGEERWQQILGLMQFAANVMEKSPEAERIRAYKEVQELEWQRIQKRLFSHVPPF
ncbi:hypothetical protein Pan44_25640 [Caulifigura coniformis]|uniref:Uncharacterized protein n=1 Tax=Caulifigura coniformis TaxID=2527983 RepID=A0A517SEI3_9PLAN|nr:hypothetical protein [Caulifigura coniformis]QDT54531.1 hypothetical protein Pan44_25640 [Caulifigura coniformis]